MEFRSCYVCNEKYNISKCFRGSKHLCHKCVEIKYKNDKVYNLKVSMFCRLCKKELPYIPIDDDELYNYCIECYKKQWNKDKFFN